MRRKSSGMLALALILFLIAGCQSSSTGESDVPMSIQLSSPAFNDGEAIPKKYTCDGDNVSPELNWNGIPDKTQSLALITDDPDAPSGTWVHWVIFNLPANLTSLPQGAGNQSTSPGVEGNNDFRKTGYNGPCPPKGKPHRYFFKIYALDTTLNLKGGVTKADVEKAMRGHTLAQGQLIGTYGR